HHDCSYSNLLLVLSFSSFPCPAVKKACASGARGLVPCQATFASLSFFPAVCALSAHVSLRLKRGALPVSTDRSVAALSMLIMVRSIGGRGVYRYRTPQASRFFVIEKPPASKRCSLPEIP